MYHQIIMVKLAIKKIVSQVKLNVFILGIRLIFRECNFLWMMDVKLIENSKVF